MDCRTPNMYRFHQAFPIRETLSLVLSWSHYNRLSSIENPAARNWHMRQFFWTSQIRHTVCDKLRWSVHKLENMRPKAIAQMREQGDSQ